MTVRNCPRISMGEFSWVLLAKDLVMPCSVSYMYIYSSSRNSRNSWGMKQRNQAAMKNRKRRYGLAQTDRHKYSGPEYYSLKQSKNHMSITIGPVLIVWFNYCVLSFAKGNCEFIDCVCFSQGFSTIETRNSQ